MSLSNSASLARTSTHILSSRAPTATFSRVAVPTISDNVTPRSQRSPTRPNDASTSLASISVTPRPALTPIWFKSTTPWFDLPPPGNSSMKPEDERKVKLGKTLRIIREHLPTLLQSPLPQEILSPNISLHLFPSTHPYLPAVSGRVAYMAALWTSPIVWNRVPIVGDVRLEILSERMVSQPVHFSPRRPGAYGEQLVVKWRTASSPSSERDVDSRASLMEQGEQKLDAHLRGSQTPGKKKPFTGLFVFEFDKDCRIISHTIEHVDEHGEWDKCVGARVVGLTDWLLGGIKGRSENGGGLPALCEVARDREPRKGLR
ncbi:hypothetical protein F4823DRAFT_544369 [Ustulina deusta]|nr:hypothetical protein F4823DRAFT_544369 [Ustulina deusta]